MDAARRVEVVDNETQFRLTFSSNATGQFTDFFSNTNGNLQIMPSGQRVGINLNSDPTANLDVNGNVRIRNVQAATPNSILIGVNAAGGNDINVRRLDFTGNANQVLLGNGTWGTAPSNVTANNGVFISGRLAYSIGRCLCRISFDFYAGRKFISTMRVATSSKLWTSSKEVMGKSMFLHKI